MVQVYKQDSYKRVVVAHNNIYSKLFGTQWLETTSTIYFYNNIDLYRLHKSGYSFKTRAVCDPDIYWGLLVSGGVYRVK